VTSIAPHIHSPADGLNATPRGRYMRDLLLAGGIRGSGRDAIKAAVGELLDLAFEVGLYVGTVRGNDAALKSVAAHAGLQHYLHEARLPMWVMVEYGNMADRQMDDANRLGLIAGRER
jgi:hypothetical protein